jgi:hypothetical protein
MGFFTFTRRPYAAINTNWYDSEVANIRDDATFPVADDTTYIIALPGDSGETQSYVMAIFAGTGRVAALIDKLVLNVRAKKGTSSTHVFKATLKIGGAQLPPVTIPLTTSWADYTCTFEGSWNIPDMEGWSLDLIATTVPTGFFNGIFVSLTSVQVYGFPIPQII